MADAHTASDAVSMHQSSVATFPFLLPDHLIETMSALIVLGAMLGLVLFCAALLALETTRASSDRRDRQTVSNAAKGRRRLQPDEIRAREWSK
jgi:hypothetical protein